MAVAIAERPARLAKRDAQSDVVAEQDVRTEAEVVEAGRHEPDAALEVRGRTVSPWRFGFDSNSRHDLALGRVLVTRDGRDHRLDVPRQPRAGFGDRRVHGLAEAPSPA